MKTIESILSQLSSTSFVEDLRKILREKDADFRPVENAFRDAMKDLASRIGLQATKELIDAIEKQICSDLVYAAYLGFQDNLANFRNPIANQFTNLDYDTFLRLHVMQTMPCRADAETAEAVLREAFEEDLYTHEDAIRNYNVYLEVTGPKIAHFLGYQFANQLLPFFEPGYVADAAQSSMYALRFHHDFGFTI